MDGGSNILQNEDRPSTHEVDKNKEKLIIDLDPLLYHIRNETFTPLKELIIIQSYIDEIRSSPS